MTDTGAGARVVVVGGGIAGVSTVAALRSAGYAGEVVLVDRAAFPYDRPPLSKEYLAGASDRAALGLQQPGWYAEHAVELLPGTEATALVPGEDTVVVRVVDGAGAERELVADQVVLATGGRPVRPAIPGADSGRVHVLREVADADRLRDALVPGARLLVVGAGLIGAEVASTARGLGCDVVLVDPLDPPLAAAVGPGPASWLHARHAAYGVETVATTVESLQETPGGIAAQLRGEADSREFDAVLLAVGMSPAVELAAAAGLATDRGVLVDERQVTSHPRVLAVGDASQPRGAQRSDHWEAAEHDGQRAAATVRGAEPAAASAPWFWSDRYHRHVEAVGEQRAADAMHTVVVRGEYGDEPFSVWTLRDGLVIGVVSVDDPRAVRAARRIIDRGIAVDPAVLADPASDLRRLLRG
jgi:NADPH-dependent 2,4-dienoyl-CoA reductase/sulfur reductase-like enzyme